MKSKIYIYRIEDEEKNIRSYGLKSEMELQRDAPSKRSSDHLPSALSLLKRIAKQVASWLF